MGKNVQSVLANKSKEVSRIVMGDSDRFFNISIRNHSIMINCPFLVYQFLHVCSVIKGVVLALWSVRKWRMPSLEVFRVQDKARRTP